MERCATCKWWATGAADEEFPNEFPPRIYPHEYEVGPDGQKDYSKPIRASKEWGSCMKVAEFGPRSPAEKFYVVDGSEYRADLNCREDFGCVEHEVKVADDHA